MPNVSTQLKVERLSGSLGAEIRGLRLAEANPQDAERIHELLMEHQVLFFPGQHPTPDEHLAFGRMFGELESHPNLDLDVERERPEFFRAPRDRRGRRRRRRMAQRHHV